MLYTVNINDIFKKEKFGGYAYNHDTNISLCFISSMKHLLMAITLDVQHGGSCLQKCIEVKEQGKVLASTLAALVFYKSLLQIKYVSHTICLQGDIIHLFIIIFKIIVLFCSKATLEVLILFCLSFQGVRIKVYVIMSGYISYFPIVMIKRYDQGNL